MLKDAGLGLSRPCLRNFDAQRCGFCPKTESLNGSGLRRQRIWSLRGSVERLKASLEKGQLLCGLGSGALCVACFWVALFASNIRKGHAYAIIFVTKSSADALVHSPMRSNYDCFVCTNCKYTGCVP